MNPSFHSSVCSSALSRRKEYNLNHYMLPEHCWELVNCVCYNVLIKCWHIDGPFIYHFHQNHVYTGIKTTQKVNRTLFLIKQKKRGRKLSSDSSSSKPRTIQKQTTWLLPVGIFQEDVWRYWQSRTHIVLEEPNRQHLNYLFVFVLFEALKKRIHSKICICLVLSD